MDWGERKKVIDAASAKVVSARQKTAYLWNNGGGKLSNSSASRSCDELTSTKFNVLNVHAELLKTREAHEDAIRSLNDELHHTWELAEALQREIDHLMPVIGD